MTGKKINWFLSLATLVGSLVGGLVGSLPYRALKVSDTSRAVWVGLVFASILIFGYIFLMIAIKFQKRYDIKVPKKNILAFLISVALLFGIGFGGQLLFAKDKSETNTETKTNPCDMVMLLDASGSMYGLLDTSNKAACHFVDNLGESCRLMAVSFADKVAGSSSESLLEMNDQNKNTVKDFINAVDLVGGTDFNLALDHAYDILNDQADSDAQKAVMILTDGTDTLDNSVIIKYKQSDITVYTIKIGETDTGTCDIQDLAKNTGGSDTFVQISSDGTINIDDLINAYNKVLEETEISNITYENKDILIYWVNDLSGWQTFIQFVVIILAAMIINYGLFARVNKWQLIVSAILGAGATLLIGIYTPSKLVFTFVVLSVLLGTSVVLMDLNGEVDYDV